MIRVVVADDSAAARLVISTLLESDPEIEVVDAVADGRAAVASVARLRPDVVTMDIQMPLLDGLEATARIMHETPVPIVVVSSSVAPGEVSSTLDALTAGAVAALPKPGSGAGAGGEDERMEFVRTVKAMAEVKVVRRWSGAYRAVPERGSPPAVPALAATPERPATLVAIAASTGGPTALLSLLASLPGQFPVPILIVQHIARGFVPGFASWLTAGSRLDVRVASDGEAARGGRVYLAPDDSHLGITAAGRICLIKSAPVHGFRPSASVLFQSAAEAIGAGLVSVIMTGMGSDGVAGLRKVRERGGHVIAQDEATSLIFGMPGEAVAAGLADEVLPLSEIGGALTRLTASRAVR